MSGPPLIFVTVGTDHHPFSRLVDWIDRWLASREGPPVRCVIQYGSASPPSNAEGVEVLPFEEVRDLCAEATAIVCQGGPASVALAREVGRRPIVVARSARLGEHVDDHQVAFARRLDREGVATCAETEPELAAALTAAIADPAATQVRPGPSAEIESTVARFAEIAHDLLDRGSGRQGAAPGDSRRRRGSWGKFHRFRYTALAGFTPEEYELFGLADEPPMQLRNFASGAQMHNVIRPALSDPRYSVLLDDKWVFARLLDSSSIPAPRTLGLLEPRIGRTWDGLPLRTAHDLDQLLAQEHPGGIAIKPVRGRQAIGVRLLTLEYDEAGPRFRLGDEWIRSEQLLEGLDPEPYEGVTGYIVQERVTQHPLLAEMMPDTLNALRVRTLVRSDGGVEILRVALRLGRRGQAFESFRSGGLSVLVTDLSRGTLGEGVTLPKYGTQRHSRHPDTGARVAGASVPCWDQVLELSRRAALVVPRIRSVGWDVAVTPQGPVVIEGNTDWDPVQTFGQGFLSPLVRAELAAAGVARPDAPPTLSMAARRLRRSLGRRALARMERAFGMAAARGWEN